MSKALIDTQDRQQPFDALATKGFDIAFLSHARSILEGEFADALVENRDLENFKRLHAEGAISVGVLITRGESLQQSLRKAVHRFIGDRNIAGFDDLAANGYVPTPKQRANVLRRVERSKDPVAFAQAWTDNFVSNKFGQATTHWRKLIDRVGRGVGNPCPLLLIGLPASIVTFDAAAIEQLSEDEVGDEPQR